MFIFLSYRKPFWIQLMSWALFIQAGYGAGCFQLAGLRFGSHESQGCSQGKRSSPRALLPWSGRNRLLSLVQSMAGFTEQLHPDAEHREALGVSEYQNPWQTQSVLHPLLKATADAQPYGNISHWPAFAADLSTLCCLFNLYSLLNLPREHSVTRTETA